jgi:hypothetical protein
VLSQADKPIVKKICQAPMSIGGGAGSTHEAGIHDQPDQK